MDVQKLESLLVAHLRRLAIIEEDGLDVWRGDCMFNHVEPFLLAYKDRRVTQWEDVEQSSCRIKSHSVKVRRV